MFFFNFKFAPPCKHEVLYRPQMKLSGIYLMLYIQGSMKIGTFQ